MNEAMKLAEMIAANAPIAVRAAKKAMRIRYMNSLDNDLAAEAELFGSCFETQDQQMAMTAFVSKTKKTNSPANNIRASARSLPNNYFTERN